MRVEPRQQARACGTAASGVVKLGVTNAVVGKAIELGSLDFAAITSEVAESHVIAEDNNEVGFGSILGKQRGREVCKNCDAREAE